MLRSELLAGLKAEIGDGEWRDMAEGGLVIGDFNRAVLIEMKDARVSADAEVDEREVAGLTAALEGYLREHMSDRPEGWRWIRLASLYLAFVTRRPMHPMDRLGIRETILEDGRTVYECPEKSPSPRAVCRWCVCRRMSNYEIMKRRMQAAFLDYDQEAMIAKFRLRSDERWLYLRFVGRDYRVSRANGTVEWTEDGFATAREAGYNDAMTIYDVLCNSAPGCRAAGTFRNMSALNGIQGGAVTQSGGMLQSAVRWLDAHQDRIAMACEGLGGTPDARGDVGYRLPMFDFLDVILRFWASDEDFPASLDIMVDDNMLDFMHYETVWFAIIHLLERVREQMEKVQEVGR